jgi:molybdenum cofactor cytidylyltransferase
MSQNMSKIGIVILAAGASRRLGQPKQLVMLGHKTLLAHTVDCAIASQADETVVVAGEIVYQNPVSPVVYNADWSEGMATSVGCGLKYLMANHFHLSAVVISVCDQPFISTALIDQLIATYRLKVPAIVASDYGDILGVPALFDRRLFSELLALRGDTGARKLIQKYRASCELIDFPAGKVDIDTPEDLLHLDCRLSSQG